GMAYCLDQFGPALKLPWSRLEAPDLTPALRQKLIEGTRREAGTRDYATLNSERDRALVAIQKALQTGSDDKGTAVRTPPPDV
ncbi:MAG: L-carnitine dehydrogenase, partial [Gammaproteobacteria bacterium]|nr:L-carnitine dehydrogenase [Gammaproteobacteria bacterium]